MDTFRKSFKIATLSAALLLAVGVNNVHAQSGNYNNNNYNNNNYNNNYNDYDVYDNASYQDFYDDLSPYGEWINDRDYGYIWIPDVDQSFRPYYTNGNWAMTEYGNTWVSNYPWGWAAFHYGRWTYDNYYGWVWIPGSEWAPAWVNWRSANNGYYGWAPMAPGYDLDYYSNNNYYGSSFWWIFAPQQYLYANNFYNYTRSPRYNSSYLRNSRFLSYTERNNNYRFFAGPRRGDIERATGRPVRSYTINNLQRPGVSRIGSNSINIFRPNITSTGGNNGYRPQRVQQGTIRIGNSNTSAGGGQQPGTRPQQAVDNSNTELAAPVRFQRANNGMQLTAQQRMQLQNGQNNGNNGSGTRPVIQPGQQTQPDSRPAELNNRNPLTPRGQEQQAQQGGRQQDQVRQQQDQVRQQQEQVRRQQQQLQQQQQDQLRQQQQQSQQRQQQDQQRQQEQQTQQRQQQDQLRQQQQRQQQQQQLQQRQQEQQAQRQQQEQLRQQQSQQRQEQQRQQEQSVPQREIREQARPAEQPVQREQGNGFRRR